MPEAQENQVVVPDTTPQNEPEASKPELSQAELDARSAGWVPKDEFVGDEHKWVDAGEFLRRGELFKKIESQGREIKEVRRALQTMAQESAKIKDVEYRRALETLKQQKKDALLDGDADAVINIDEQIDTVKEAQRNFKEQAAVEVRREAEQIHPEFAAWTNRNAWYTTNAPMKAFADTLGQTLAAQGKSPSEVLAEVERQVRNEFPNRFKNPNRDKPGAVEGASAKGATSKSAYQPTDFERQVAKRFVQQGVFKNEQEYYKQLEGKS